MYDTVAISESYAHSPDVALLERNGCIPFFSEYTGEPYKLVLNGERGAKEPRLTILKTPKDLWNLKAEVSFGAWVYDSNLFLPDERDIENLFPMLSEFVGDITGLRFDARLGRVTRLDVTRDFQIGEARLSTVLKELCNVEIPKYDRKPFNNTGVYFENKGRVKNKKYSFYDKHQDLLDKEASQAELDLAKGLMRFELQHKNNKAVANLAKSLGLRDHKAINVLTRATSEKTIERAMQLFCLGSLLANSDSNLEKLLMSYKTPKAQALIGHLVCKGKFGSDYHKLPFITLKEATIKKYERECAKSGVLSIE